MPSAAIRAAMVTTSRCDTCSHRHEAGGKERKVHKRGEARQGEASDLEEVIDGLFDNLPVRGVVRGPEGVAEDLEARLVVHAKRRLHQVRQGMVDEIR